MFLNSGVMRPIIFDPGIIGLIIFVTGVMGPMVLDTGMMDPMVHDTGMMCPMFLCFVSSFFKTSSLIAINVERSDGNGNEVGNYNWKTEHKL